MWIHDPVERDLAYKVQELKEKIEMNKGEESSVDNDKSMLEFYRHLWAEIIWRRD